MRPRRISVGERSQTIPDSSVVCLSRREPVRQNERLGKTGGRMNGDDIGRVAGSGSVISVAEDLQRLRHEAGGVSYAEIAARVTSLRADRSGRSSVAVSRSTVYDAFRPGRTRLDADLVVDIVRSLGVDEAEAEDWRARCVARTTSSALPARRSSSPPRRPRAAR